MTPERVQIELFKKQLEFMKQTTRYVHFCGGIGSGKTYVGAIWMVKAVLEHDNIRALICARDFGQLRNATLVEFNSVLKLFGLIEDKHYTFNKSVFEYQFFNGTVIVCTGMNNPDSALRGPSYGIVWADEAEFYDKEAWLKLKGRVRRNPGLIRITSSPNGFNHMYDEFEVRKDPTKVVIKSTTYDNPTLPPEYVEDLRASYSPKMFSQEVMAERVSLNQQSVYDEFDRTKHIQPCAEMLQPTDQLFAFLDYNINRYPAVYMFMRNNTIYSIGEEWLEFGGSRQMAQRIKARWPDRNVIVVGDSQGNNAGNVAADYSNYEIFRQEGIITKTFTNPPVQQRIINSNSRLYHHKVVIDPSCEKLIRDLEQVSYDDQGKILKNSGNIDLTHISDAWSYGLWYFMPLRRTNISSDLNLI